MKNKLIPKAALYIGQLVVVTQHPEAQVRTVAGISGYMAILQWFEGKQLCCQGYRTDGLFTPTLEQIEYSIAANGALASTRDLREWV